MSSLLSATLCFFSHTRYDKPPRALFSYPHLGPSDTIIWNKFLDQNPDFFEAVSYDVHVGRGTYNESETDQAIINMAKALTQRRIDVLAEKDGFIYIIELKAHPGITILGQLLGYRVLMLYETRDIPPIKLMSIVDAIDEDLKVCLLNNDIEIVCVGR